MRRILGANSKLDRARWQPIMSLVMQVIAHREPVERRLVPDQINNWNVKVGFTTPEVGWMKFNFQLWIQD